MNKALRAMMKGAVWRDYSSISGRPSLLWLPVNCLSSLYHPASASHSVSLFLSLQAVLFDIINKNFDKIKRPRGDGKALIYWGRLQARFFFFNKQQPV